MKGNVLNDRQQKEASKAYIDGYRARLVASRMHTRTNLRCVVSERERKPVSGRRGPLNPRRELIFQPF